MKTPHLSLRNELIQSLEKLTGQTEGIFLYLGREFPKLMNEMRRSMREPPQGMDGVTSGPNGDHNAEDITGILQKTRSVIDAGSTAFNTLHKTDDALFQDLDEGIQNLSRLDVMIEAIKEDSIEMELVSLNAMTVALKSGNAGRAFSYITDELKRISTSTIRLTEDITSHGNALLQSFHSFREELSEVRNFQDSVFQAFHENLTESFNALRSGVDHVVSALSGIKRQAQDVEAPLTSIMQSVQFQDIIKQSTDHVIITLKEIDDLKSDASEEERLDELAFLRSLPDLSDDLLADIKENLSSSLDAFRDHTSRVESIISGLEEERSRFVREKLGTGENSIQVLFETASELLNKLLADLEDSIGKKSRIAASSQKLVKDLYVLEENFRAFNTIISRFHSIDIASRIEVAKQEVLQRMSGTVEQMNSLTHRIEEDVSTSLDSTKRFIFHTDALLKRCREAFQEEETFIKSFSEEIEEQYRRLDDARRMMFDTISGFSIFTDAFFRLFSDTKSELEKLSTVLATIDEVRDRLRGLREQSDAEMRPLLEKRGITNWDINSKRLQDMIERFTIFTHKKTAGDLGGFEVESGVEAGDVTLF
jgi:hypothetical protein